MKRIYGDRYPEELDSEALEIILANSPTAHPDQFLSRPVYIFNGGSDDAEILAFNQRDIQELKADFPQARLEWTVLDEVGHRVPSQISRQTAAFFQSSF